MTSISTYWPGTGDTKWHTFKVAQQVRYGFDTYIRLTAPCPGLPRWASTRKVKPIWILLKQETVSVSGISWATCKSAPRSRQITMPAPHHSCFLQAGCPSCCPTNSVKALKATVWIWYCSIYSNWPTRGQHWTSGSQISTPSLLQMQRNVTAGCMNHHITSRAHRLHTAGKWRF